MWFFRSFWKSLVKVVGFIALTISIAFALGGGLPQFPRVASSAHGKQLVEYCSNYLDFVLTCLFDRLVDSLIFIVATSFIHWVAVQRPIGDAKTEYEEARRSAQPFTKQLGQPHKNRNRSMRK